VPEDLLTTFDCVRRAIRQRRPEGTACKVPRARALGHDAEVVAAQSSARPAAVIDLTRQFCGPRWCYPVVGGVLVHKDRDHLGQLFASTLGPILLRKVREVLAPYRGM
jgi:hypothetical protein